LILRFIHKVIDKEKDEEDLNEENNKALFDAEVELVRRAILGHVGSNGKIVDVLLDFDLLTDQEVCLLLLDLFLGDELPFELSDLVVSRYRQLPSILSGFSLFSLLFWIGYICFFFYVDLITLL